MIGDDVLSYVLDNLNNNALIDALNNTHIVMIPKKKVWIYERLSAY